MSNALINSLAIKSKEGDRDAYEQLYDMIAPKIGFSIRKYSKNSMVDKDILELDAVKHFNKAIQNFDPEKGNFKTYVEPYIDKVRRVVYQHANVGYIPEHRMTQIRTFQDVKGNLEGRLRRPASNSELADELGWGESEVARMQKELKPDFIMDDQLTKSVEDNKLMLHYINYELSPEEKPVYERLIGLNGLKMSPQQISSDLNININKVYNLKKSITKKVEKFLQEY